MTSLLVFSDVDGTLIRIGGLGWRSLDDAFCKPYGVRSVLDVMRIRGVARSEVLS